MQFQRETTPPEDIGNGSVSLAAVEWGLTAAALPTIAAGTNSPIGLAHWVLMAHYLAIAYGCHLLRTLRLFAGPRVQRRSGFLMFLVGSLACAVAPDAYTLVAARLPQAFGIACLLAVPARGAVTDRLPIVALVIGLLAGSVVANLVGWRAVFVVTAIIGMLAAMRHWPREGRANDPPEVRPLQEQFPKRHPMLLACGLACIIVPVNSYCDFRTFGLAEAILLLVGIVLFAAYAHEAICNLIASRSPLLSLWLGAVVAGLCLLPALFHVPDFPAPIPALGLAACGLALRLTRNLPPVLGRLAAPAGFLLLAVTLWIARASSALESLPFLAATAAVAGVALGLAWTGCTLQPVPLFSGLAVGVYAASYFLEFIPARFGSLPSPDARDFLREESSVLFAAACVAFTGVGWSIVRAAKPLNSQRVESGAGKGV